ncbi:MAG: hypothetical protein H6699_10715 [Myxococcales bacterium]|nr:hypothetical protein [Myxococcales bacterium]
MPRLSIAITLLLALFVGSPRAAAQTSVVVKLGQELDTNPRRVDGDPGPAFTASRVVVNLDDRRDIAQRGMLDLSLDALGRHVFGLGEEDSLGLSGGASLRGDVRDRGVLGVSLSTRDRFEPARDCDAAARCSANQDYRAAALSVFGARDTDWGGYGVDTGLQLFRFRPDGDLDRLGPTGGAWLELQPTDPLRLTLGYDVSAHYYSGARTTLGTNGGTYVDPDESRRDTEHIASLAAAWRTTRWRLGARYSLTLSRSNSSARSYDRHVVEPSVTGLLVGDLLVRVSARVVRARYDRRASLDATLDVDDDARNRVSVTLEHPLAGPVSAELGYSVFTQSIALSSDADTAHASYVRHIAVAALTFGWRSDQ